MSESDPTETKRTAITAASVKAAAREAKLGEESVRPDAVVGGLELQVKGHKVSWSLRTRLHGKQIRRRLGNDDLSPDAARFRALKIKELCKAGIDPKRALIEMLTGVSVPQQRREEADRPVPSIPWEEARDWWLGEIKRTRSIDTLADYRKKIVNTPEMKILSGRMVATITASDIAQILKKVALRAGYPSAEGLQRTLSSMWTDLADPLEAERTGVKALAIRHAKAPERPAPTYDDDEDDLSSPPSLLDLGRTVAIAKSGALGLEQSAAILLLAGSLQRRRTVMGCNRSNFRTFDDEECWAIPPFFRKTSKKKRSKGLHIVPLVGWAAEAKRVLDRIAPKGQNWLLPTGRVKKGKTPRTRHKGADNLTVWLTWIPGVTISPHPFRAALATYGPEHLGWASGDAKLILDHLEGFDGGDVTAQHYNTNPDIKKKRGMLIEWLAFLDKCAKEAIAADPELKDAERVGELSYIKRNDEESYKKQLRWHSQRLAQGETDSKLPWQKIERLIVETATIESLDIWRKKRVPI